MRKLCNVEVRFRIVFVTGTIKKLQEKSFIKLKSSNEKILYELAKNIKKNISENTN